MCLKRLHLQGNSMCNTIRECRKKSHKPYNSIPRPKEKKLNLKLYKFKVKLTTA